jgi:hypothetical protein
MITPEILIVILLAVLCGLATWMALSLERISWAETTINVAAPEVTVNVPALEPIIRVVLPADIETVTREVVTSGRKVTIEHRQPDGTWHPIGETDTENRERIDRELATDGRRVVFPDGTVMED